MKNKTKRNSFHSVISVANHIKGAGESGKSGANSNSEARLLLKIYRKLHKVFGPQYWWPGNSPLEIIVGAILTQNTAWGNVEKAITALKRRRLLSLSGLRGVNRKRLASIIKPAGYFNQKAVKLKAFIKFLDKEYAGSLRKMMREATPRLRRKLLEVHGIGPETADSILLYACGRPVFVVDTYTARIFGRHDLVSDVATYGDIQQYLTAALPRSVALYNEYHALIVRLGKEFCRKKPRCDECPLNRGLRVNKLEQQ